jgi:hypothetical protein
MAPKLPPPANTKAVFTRPSWTDADKALLSLYRRVDDTPATFKPLIAERGPASHQ